MEAHSQLPWEVSEDSRGVPHIFAHVPEQKRLASGEQWSVATLDFCGWKPEEIKANAAFIVRAANNHYQLLEACRMALLVFSGPEYGGAPGATDAIAALSKAIADAEKE